MGRGLLHLLARGAPQAPGASGRAVVHVPLDSTTAFPTEIGTASKLHRALAKWVAAAVAQCAGRKLMRAALLAVLDGIGSMRKNEFSEGARRKCYAFLHRPSLSPWPQPFRR